MRQAGVIAAAGLYALENNVERLQDDHANAEKLARGLRELKLDVQHNTNMVLVKIAAGKSSAAGRAPEEAATSWCCRARRCGW